MKKLRLGQEMLQSYIHGSRGSGSTWCTRDAQLWWPSLPYSTLAEALTVVLTSGFASVSWKTQGFCRGQGPLSWKLVLFKGWGFPHTHGAKKQTKRKTKCLDWAWWLAWWFTCLQSQLLGRQKSEESRFEASLGKKIARPHPNE
jgi:hypothetical protein